MNRFNVPQPEFPELTVFVANAKGKMVPHEISPVVVDGRATYDVKRADPKVEEKLTLAISTLISSTREKSISMSGEVVADVKEDAQPIRSFLGVAKKKTTKK